ncbi:hypothetical protein AGDE_01180 [Angomonas deanei]|nr:hypothetical protein AGDE_01180 [Angomonas deanei]|eukprot:EPY42743.1 hypothetical protein AGDE_01180 [Angomonas deanei]
MNASPEVLANTPLPRYNVKDGITVWTAEDCDELEKRCKANPSDKAAKDFKDFLFSTINILGAKSKRAQGIGAVLTSVSKLHEKFSSSEPVPQKLYILFYQNQGMGILKTGVKKLFISHPKTNTLVEVEPLAVLDFFVDDTYQRKGFGKQLFVKVLEEEGLMAHPERLAIDRPSEKFLQFLAKHYHLTQYTPQVNHFVVFWSFF